MNPFTRIVGGPVETKAINLSRLTWTSLGAGTKSGVAVSMDRALRVSAAFACVKVVSEDVAKVPFKLFRQVTDKSRKLAYWHPGYFLFSRRPNDWMTPSAFVETMQMWACLSHGGCAYVSRNDSGKLLELIPLLPSDVTPTFEPLTRQLVFDVAMPNGEVKRLARSAVFYLRGLSWDTAAGLETWRLAADAIGLAVATEEGTAKLHANGGRPGGILSTEKSLQPAQVESIKGRWDAAHGGVGKWGGTALLDNGLKYTQLSVVGAAAETLETRRFQIEEQARFFRVHPQKIMQADKTATYASAEQFALAHVLDTILPWAVRWEQAAGLDMLTDEEWREGYFFKLMLQGLLRGDAKTRSEFYKSAINDGWMTRNEVRALEDLDALAGLDVPLAPQNMGTVQKDGSIVPISKPERLPPA